ncbi:MAG: hypothetical protein R3F19_29235 [Verrucomicrobiales bacterium]
MKKSRLESLSRLLQMITVLAAALLIGCIESSVVVKVKKDGSGILHMRTHTAALVFNGEEADNNDENIPNREKLIAHAGKLGKGVTLQSFKKSKNRSGWPGFEVIYAFDDINDVEVHSLMISDDDEKANQKNGFDKGNDFRFRMTDGKLTIVSNSPLWSPSTVEADESAELALVGAVDPFADKPALEESAGISIDLTSAFSGAEGKLAEAMLKGARMGFFVEVDGEIASTDAHFRRENLITLVDLELDKAVAGARNLEASMKSAKTVEEAQALADKMAGMNFDLKPEISVVFK